MRVISASRRTDIPAFYTRWLLARLRAGFCHWINPFGGGVHRVSLRPEDCLAFVFWTRNPLPLLPHIASMRDAGYYGYFHITINGYPRVLESANPSVITAVRALRLASTILGGDLVNWRYDPIVLSSQTPAEYHMDRFDTISRALEGATHRCYFSFVDMYGKTARNLDRVSRDHGIRFDAPTLEQRQALVHSLRDIAASRGITLYACCEADLVGDGVESSHCIDLDTIRALRSDADVRLRSAPTRAECGCVESVDIGAYDTCTFGCSYCYATSSRGAALDRLRAHDPQDTVLYRPPKFRGVDLAAVEHVPRSSTKKTVPSTSDDGVILLQPRLT
jgi:hypothetical protein